MCFRMDIKEITFFEDMKYERAVRICRGTDDEFPSDLEMKPKDIAKYRGETDRVYLRDMMDSSFEELRDLHGVLLPRSCEFLEKAAVQKVINHELFPKTELTVRLKNPDLIGKLSRSKLACFMKIDLWIADFYEKWRDWPRDEDVLLFIRQFKSFGYEPYDCIESEVDATIEKLFMNGGCWYFAHMLKEAFSVGDVYWAAPFGHFVYGVHDRFYDVRGHYDGEAMYFIPEQYLKPSQLANFIHIPGFSGHNTTVEEVLEIIRRYCERNNLIYDSYVEILLRKPQNDIV